MAASLNEPQVVAKGSGWRVFRLGRSSCIQIDRDDRPEPAEVWTRNRASDVVRTSLLGSLVSGAHGKVDERAALEAMEAEW